MTERDRVAQNARAAEPDPAFHAIEASAALALLGSSTAGLDDEEALRRIAIHGRNELPEAPGRHPLLRFLSHFNNALIYFLIAGAAAAALVGHLVDAGVILAVVVVNAIVGFVQEGRAEDALAAIRGMIAPHASVLRAGRRGKVDVGDLVPGDLVLIEAGDRVPADLRLIRARNLLIDEAALTGESVAAQKSEAPVAADAALGDRFSMAYSGTMAAAGQGAGVVVATGARTQIGRISELIGGVEELTTPLLRRIDAFGRSFTRVALAGAAALFVFAVYARGFDWVDALIAVVALSVGMAPEGLPAVITITLAIGVQRMAARNAVIRKLPAVETLGATTVICSDKTGTLTRNEMTARRVVAAREQLDVGGSGYSPDGHVILENAEHGRSAALHLARAALLCNDAQLRLDGDEWRAEGDPMEGALVTLAMKAGFDPENARAEWARLDEIPFDAAHRFMATLHRAPLGEIVAFVKGAPERLLEMSARQALDVGEEPLDASYWTACVASAAADGERVLGFAMKRFPAGASRLTFEEVEGELTFLGLVGFIDPPRAEAIKAVAQCRTAGIAVKMITGDHAATALAIARRLGLADDPKAVTGRDLDDLPDEAAFSAAVRDAAVFARTSPEHKLRIVRALQAQGEIVAMTGDGVNDAPALKQADVGVAMGGKGTEAAKEASQIVLLDDNFASIVDAVREGRTVYDNIRKVVSWTLPTNGGEVLAVIAAIVFNFTMPMTATQILWINLVLTVTLGLVLAFEPSEPNVMRRRPRRPDAGLLSPFLVWRIVFVSLLFLAATLVVFFSALADGRDVETARTMVVNMIVVLEIFYLFNVRYLGGTSFTLRGALGTPPVLIAIAVVFAAQIAFTYAPPMQVLFETRPLSLSDGALIVGIGMALMAILEVEKWIARRFFAAEP